MSNKPPKKPVKLGLPVVGPGTYIEHKDGYVTFTIVGVGETAGKALGMVDRLRSSIIMPKAED